MSRESLWQTLGGAAAGLVNGFFGGGGGQALLPALLRGGRMEEKRAFATCVAVIAPICLVSGGESLLRGGVTLAGVWPYLAGGLLGGWIAGKTFRRLPPVLLRRALALLLLYGGARSLFWS